MRRGRGTRGLATLLLRAALVTGAATLWPAPATAQGVPRPDLPDGADPNDWEAYYDLGTSLLARFPERADAAYVWASRLNPARAEPLYARSVAFWMRDVGRFEGYLRDDERVLRDTAVLGAEALRAAALRRNPFVHEGLMVLAYDRLPGRWADNALTRAWIALGQARLPLALEGFGRLVQRDPGRYGYLRFTRASAFVNLAQFDSAASQLDALLAQLRRRDEAVVGNGYQSKELLEYAVGLIHLQRGRTSAARDAFARSLLENAGFAPSHARLGELAAAAGDTATMLVELGMAVEIDPRDPTLQIGYGRALLMANRPREAVPSFRNAIALAPFYAEPYLYLGVALESSGDADGARGAFGDFLARAKRADQRRAYAEEKLRTPPTAAP